MNGAGDTDLLRWVVALPLLAAAYHGIMLGLVRRPTPRAVTIGISCGSVLGSFVLACVSFWQLLGLPEDRRVLVDEVYTWIAGGIGPEVVSAEVSFLLDPISAVMALVVTGVGFLIHVYSVGYMDADAREDRGFQRFFCYLGLFTFSMLVLVLADNLVLLYVGWEGVGLCSYLLIGFWYSDRHNAFCGSKAFVVNRIGDMGLLIGIFVLFRALSEAGTPTMGFADIEAAFASVAGQKLALPAWVPLGPPDRTLANVVAICFFIGVCGKSAQLPLHVWLPDAMAGPTPVSALIHAATMVTAGVYLLCRLSFVYAAAPEAQALVAWTGGATALFAATVALAQNDIKKVLAWSTVSQLGFMVMAAGCGGHAAAIFHLGTHAFFKALLFLAAGSVILAVHHEQDVRRMGGLRRRLPQTHWLFFLGVLAIAGFPGFAGFFSKEEVLGAVRTAVVPGAEELYWMAIATAGLTAFYMFRLHFLVFAGELRREGTARARIAEPGAWVLQPMWILVFFVLFGGLVGFPQLWGDLVGVPNSNSMARFVTPALAGFETRAVEHRAEWLVVAAATGAMAAGILLAWILYVRRRRLLDRVAEGLPTFARLLGRGYYLDALYDRLLVRPTVWISDRVLYRAVDAGLVDGGLVHGTARAVRGLASHGLKYAQSGLAQSYVFVMIVGAMALVGFLLGSA